MPVSPREHSSESPAVEVSREKSRTGEQRNCGDRPLATAGSVARSAQVFKLQKALRKYLSVVRTFLLEMFKLQSQTAGV